MYYLLDINNAFSRTQGGFRKRLRTIDQAACFEIAVRTAIVNRQICIAVFFDLSNAFDKVWHTALIYKLVQSGISGRLLQWIREYLNDRLFQVYFDDEFSTNRSMSSGVPQGSTTSPLLFNVMLRLVFLHQSMLMILLYMLWVEISQM